MPIPPPRHRNSAWLVALVAALLAQAPILGYLYYSAEYVRLPGPCAPGWPLRDASCKTPERVVVVPVRKVQPKPKGQIVTLPEPPKKQKAPKNARYLARHDHKVKEEMKARRRTPGKQVRAKEKVRKRSKVQSADSRSPRPTRLPKASKSEIMRSARRSPEAPKGRMASGQQDQRKRARKLLFPKVPRAMDLSQVQMLSSTGGSDDALPRVKKEGEETLLNARRYRFISFFERVKSQVRPYWEPTDALRQRDPSGRAFCCKDRLTVLRVVLDKQGRITDIEVARRSGLRFLDREALRAFRAGAPFPNPPKDLFEGDKLEFQFGFLLEFRDGHPLMKWVPPSPL